MNPDTKFYIGVQGVLLRDRADEGGCEMVAGAESFLNWAVMRFDCRWLSALNKDGGDDSIRRAIADARGHRWSAEDLDLIFELVQSTYWEEAMVEAIDLDSEFYWLASQCDETSMTILGVRGVADRLLKIDVEKGVDEFARVRCLLECV